MELSNNRSGLVITDILPYVNRQNDNVVSEAPLSESKFVFLALPHELLAQIFAELPSSKVCNLSTLSHLYNKILNSDEIWQLLCNSENLCNGAGAQKLTWKKVYEQKSDCSLKSIDKYMSEIKNKYLNNQAIKVLVHTELLGKVSSCHVLIDHHSAELKALDIKKIIKCEHGLTCKIKDLSLFSPCSYFEHMTLISKPKLIANEQLIKPLINPQELVIFYLSDGNNQK
jgi:hypothetical protein